MTLARSRVADIVVPISYAVKRAQHAHGLAAYKAQPPSWESQTNLLSLLLLFVKEHLGCVARASRVAGWSHAAVVPSTRNRPGEHPLRALVGGRLGLPWAELSANPHIPSEVREFRVDRFEVSGGDLRGARVLLLDDTWTTGSRVQSASYALKLAGADKVAAVVLGRHVNPEWEGWKPIIQEIKDKSFRSDRCAVHS
ncbi:phosphoribosyltransferase [Streptosporangium sp. NBC_01469]|uniref:phosphoribosyltransferase n=1 Tax=Streptosporangium sp. NBC_01469 TaxID=2903898 RepID=UPI002E2C3EE7|nr:phosphoribosyltransferase [Streptosporangium sp. NBC_01469]